MGIRVRISALVAWLLLAGHAAGAWSQERPFYFRLDTGHAWAQPAGFRDRVFTPIGLGYLVCGNPPCTSQMSIDHLGQSTIAGAGIGWRFSPRLRADLTYSTRQFTLDGQDQFPEKVHADVNSSVAMLNGYWDFRDEGQLRPFIGAGIGMARNRTGITTDSFIPGPGTIEASAGVKSSTAFSLSAGAGYAVYKGVVVEVGYRYFDLGKFQTGNTVTFAGAFGIPYQGAEGRLRTNELTLGVRF